YRVRELLQLGMGRWVDGSGIDWWDVLSLMIEPDLRCLMLVGGLARELPTGCELYASRSSPLAATLQTFTGSKQVKVETGFRPGMRWDKHYREHFVRRRLARRRRNSKHPVVLLPSAYVNVSRTAASYAALLPGENF